MTLRGSVIAARVKTKTRNSHLLIVHRIQACAVRLADPLDLARAAADIIREAVPDLSATISLIEHRNGCLVVRGHAGPGPLPEEARTISLSDTGRVMAMVARGERPSMAAELRSDGGPRPLDPGSLSSLDVPICAKQEIVGVLTLEAPRAHAFGDDEVVTFETVAAMLGAAIDNAHLFERIEQEKEEWARTFDAITDMVSIHDGSFRLLRGNRALLARAGVPAYALTGQTCEEIYARVIGRPAQCPHPEAERKGRPASREVETPGGSAFRVTALPRFDAGSLTYSVHVCEDITEERRLREQLLQSEKMSAVGQLVSGVAHELNNPLAGVMGYTQLMMRHLIEPKMRADLERVFNEAQRAARIVQNLLTFARKHKPEKRLLGLNGIIEKTLELRAYELRVSNIEVETDLDPGLPKTLLDLHQMQQVILNILTNAEQAMLEAHGRGRLRIATRAAGSTITMRLQDDGPGIATEHLSRVFEPFFTTKPVGRGTGLGLSICDGIVKEHGGGLRVESAPGQGAVFIVELPVAAAEEPADAPGIVTHAAAAAGGRSILVVDDEPSIQGLLVEALARAGFEVDTAGNGASALAKIEKRRYDLIISDLKMPGVSGVDLYERIRETRPDLAARIVFTSGDTVSDGTEAFLRRTGNMTLLKPFSLEELHAALGRFFGSEGLLLDTRTGS